MEDATAAIGMATRIGPGKVKHLELRHLALQSWIRDGRLTISKVGTENQLGDLMTKAVDHHRLVKLGSQLGLRFPVVGKTAVKVVQLQALWLASGIEGVKAEGVLQGISFEFAMCAVLGFVFALGALFAFCLVRFSRKSSRTVGTQVDQQPILPQEFFVTNFGECVHVDEKCFGLRHARTILKKRQCNACFPYRSGDG